MRSSKKHHYCVYILTNRTRRLYVGVTGDLERRMCEAKGREIDEALAELKRLL